MFRTCFIVNCTLLLYAPPAFAQDLLASYIKNNYTRQSHKIPMRDGVHLFTIVYAPKDATQKYPIIMTRTPYGVHPYEDDKYRGSLGPNKHFVKEGFIFVYQDVRGRYMSEGDYANMRPQLQKKGGPKDIDESTDTYDTIDWLVKNVPNNSGKVGLYGISYPGFYTSAGMVNAHPALKAASPQAPIADWFFDDFFHHGAFFLPHAFGFFDRFGDPRGPELTTKNKKAPSYGTQDGYRFFLELGSLTNVNPRYYKDKITFWNEMAAHPTYDKFWQDRNLLPHLKKVAPAVMTVGGHFDAEDLYGTFQTYQAIEKQNPGIFNVMVIGPWSHGQWSRAPATSLGHIDFGGDTAGFFQKEIELPFFNHFLKGKGEHGLPEAYVFETGVNQWRKFDHWPPREVKTQTFYLGAKGKLSTETPVEKSASDSFVSDPNKPVPFTEDVLHTFKKGHRVMVQVHSTWFPLADRNPQRYVENIFFANDDDFTAATHRVYRSAQLPSQIRVGVLPSKE